VTQPESGVATRYHSAETQLAASRRNSYLAQAENLGQAVNPVERDDGSVLDVGQEGNTGTEKKEGWPDVLVITGLEDCESPLQIQICDLVKQSRGEREDGNPMMVIWIRQEDKADRAPAWLVGSSLNGCLDALTLHRSTTLSCLVHWTRMRARLHRRICFVKLSYRLL
jgi:hypothetical protein